MDTKTARIQYWKTPPQGNCMTMSTYYLESLVLNVGNIVEGLRRNLILEVQLYAELKFQYHLN